VGSIVTKIGPMLGVFPMGHEDSFGPLPGLMAVYGPSEAGHNDYAGPPTVMKTAAPAAVVAAKAVRAPVPAPVGDDEEETTKVAVSRTTANTPADSIGGLIDDISVENVAGGSGAAQ
jgi:hypothetical protein